MILTFFIVMFILLMHFMWMHIEDLVGKGLSLGVIIELVMYAAATLIPMGLPLATLLASIMTLGNMGENNELLALKAAGISLPRIMRPLIMLMVVVCVGSFFVINNLTPYATNQMFTLLSDISRQKQEIKFQDGIFFNGIPDISIRVGNQELKNNKLNDILIYNNSSSLYPKMQTTVADSGYIRISDDRKYLMVTLYNGQIYEENRDYMWYNDNTLSHHIFDEQHLLLPLSGFAFERGDMDYKSNSQTQNMAQLSVTIDSIKHVQDSMVQKLSNRVVMNYVFKRYANYKSIDSIPTMRQDYLVDDMDTMGIESRRNVFDVAMQTARDAQNYVNYEVEFTSYTSSQLYKAQGSLQQKLALPFSIMIFFLIGAPLGAIIRKGGLGMPIVVSVIFFVIYYIITITGEKFVKDGAIPPFIGMWLSSFILFPLAIFLTYKSTNDSALMNADAYIIRYKKLMEYLKKAKRKIKKH